MRRYIWLLVFVLLLVGCAITDDQIERLATNTETVVKGMVDAGLKVAAPHVPGLGLLELLGGGGLAGLLGALAGRGVRKGLRFIQKKPH